MKKDHSLSSWIDPITYEQMGELMVTPESPQHNDLSPDEWWEKLKRTQEAIETAAPESSFDSVDSEIIDPQLPAGPKGVASPVTHRSGALPKSAISSIREKLDALEPKTSTHQKSLTPVQTEPEHDATLESDEETPEDPEETPPVGARSSFSQDLEKLQIPKPQPKPVISRDSSAPAETTKEQTQRALDRYNEWVTDYLSFSGACLINESGEILTGKDFDSSFKTAASTLGNAFLKATQFQLEDADPNDEIHQFPHRAAHTPWEDKYLTVIPVKTQAGLYIVAGLTSESIDRQKACMAAETLLRVAGAPKN